ncbi:hypothetical protein [Fervidobacterium thailandense]|uniref:Flagellar motor switch protein FliG middle domain-containing protein n=1 Tax=Fervidobacterium thailandense TaxID=1008305 RepID=A0A1E3G4Y9_9BACT|nr:hypothetical protein [Fervidobacterium thailandense]ODN31242.1 hypothetical protein A4H02_00195 [Fervidobacterium thailandense]
MAKFDRKKVILTLIGILIAVTVITVLFLYGYANFLARQLYGPSASIFDGWRNYVSYIFSKVPFLKNFVDYQPLETITPYAYFEKVLSEYKEQLEKLIADIESREQAVNQKEKNIDDIIKALNAVEETWKEERLKEEIAKLEPTLTKKRIDEVVDTFLNSDPAQLRRLLNAENMTVETLALIFSRLPADTRAELLQSLTAVNPQKAAQVVEKMAGVDQIISDIDFKIEELKKTLKEVFDAQASLITVSGISKGLSVLLTNLSYEELWNLVDKLKRNPDLVFYILSKLDGNTMVRLLKDIKDKDEKLFIEILSRGARF